LKFFHYFASALLLVFPTATDEVLLSSSLDEQRQALMMTGARKFLRTRMSFPSQCCDCGATIDEDKYQRRPFHEGMTPSEWTMYHRKAA
jgi:hypothetical protein